MQMYLETVPMPSMEVYNGKPYEANNVSHFEDWMQTTYHGVAKLGEKLPLTKDDKARMFLGQLDTYFEKRAELLGSDENFLFPRNRPSDKALEVSLPSWIYTHNQAGRA